MQILGEEFDKVRKMLKGQWPPRGMQRPQGKKRREILGKQQADLEKRIDAAEDAAMECPDAKSRQSMFAKIAKLREENNALLAQMEETPETINGHTKEEWQRLVDSCSEMLENSVTVPVPGKVDVIQATFFQNPHREGQAIYIPVLVFNEWLTALRCRIELEWKTERKMTQPGKKRKKGKEIDKHTFFRGHIQCGIGESEKRWIMDVDGNATKYVAKRHERHAAILRSPSQPDRAQREEPGPFHAGGVLLHSPLGQPRIRSG